MFYVLREKDVNTSLVFSSKVYKCPSDLRITKSVLAIVTQHKVLLALKLGPSKT